MKKIITLATASLILLLSSAANAKLDNEHNAEIQYVLQNVKSQRFDEQKYCSENPRDCYCTYINGRKYCFIL